MLTATLDSTNTQLTVVSDKRVIPGKPAVTENFKITVETGGETVVYSGSREKTPATPETYDPIVVTDDSGRRWNKISDNGKTAVFRIA